MNKKDSSASIASVILGLLFWIPLMNRVTSILAVYLGIIALVKIRNNPKSYTGKYMAVFGIILGLIPIYFYIFGLVGSFIIKTYNITS